MDKNRKIRFGIFKITKIHAKILILFVFIKNMATIEITEIINKNNNLNL